MSQTPMSQMQRDAFIITGPTSGVGRETALRMARHGPLVLVGRDAGKLAAIKAEVERLGGRGLPIVCDMADLSSVRRAAAAILALNLPLAGLLNNAGVQNPPTTRTADGWDMTFVTNHLGPFALTDALLPHLADGARVVFVGSATEDPERGPARRAGFRGGRYLSAEASARGQWAPGGSARPDMDAYATSKQCNTAAALALAREQPRLVFSAVEPGIMFNTGLHGGMNPAFVLLAKVLVPVLAPFVKVLSTPQRAARVLIRLLTDPATTRSGVYYDEAGHPMAGSAQLRDPAFQDRVVAETRGWLAGVGA